MNKRIIKVSLVGSMLTLLFLVPTIRLMAQDTTTRREVSDKRGANDTESRHRRYILRDLGTFGGPHSTVSFFAKILNNRGEVAGDADTSTPDPFAPNCLSPNCLV